MEEKLISIFNTVREGSGLGDLTTINDQMDLRKDIGFDSFNLAELTVHVEEEFGVDIFEDGIVNTVGEIKAKLNS
ncbi:acyl carrier protein [Nonlabens marinus]|uniref:Putative acyl carrier protein n=1 Tax=Nonlabens marinus S1-08 TaxID=1454201 RepID=W8W0Q7_9FLAO|nr:acyl carrier protein [Nonlabens marinus]BAO56746.1 putative acyl carrier protein [Nonlabens marinus S1-08]